jgi:WD40 repeat protein
VPELHGHTSRVFDLEALGTPEEVKLICSGSWDKTMMVWDAQNGKFSAELHADYWKDAVASIAAIRQAGFIREVWTGSWDGNITIWAINPPMMVRL